MDKKDLIYIAAKIYNTSALRHIFDEIRDYEFDKGFFTNANYGSGYSWSIVDLKVQGSGAKTIFSFILDYLYGHINNSDIFDFDEDTLLSHAAIHYFICIALDILARKFTLDFIKKEFLPDAEKIIDLKVTDHVLGAKGMCSDPTFFLMVEKENGNQVGIDLDTELRTYPEGIDPTDLNALMDYKFIIRVFKLVNNDSTLLTQLDFSLSNLTFDKLKPWFTECLQ